MRDDFKRPRLFSFAIPSTTELWDESFINRDVQLDINKKKACRVKGLDPFTRHAFGMSVSSCGDEDYRWAEKLWFIAMKCECECE